MKTKKKNEKEDDIWGIVKILLDYTVCECGGYPFIALSSYFSHFQSEYGQRPRVKMDG